MSPLIIMVAAFFGVTALIVGIAAMAGVFDSSKAEDRLAVQPPFRQPLQTCDPSG